MWNNQHLRGVHSSALTVFFQGITTSSIPRVSGEYALREQEEQERMFVPRDAAVAGARDYRSSSPQIGW